MSTEAASTGFVALDGIMKVIGIDATLALAEAFGGRRLYVGRQFPTDHPVVALIGGVAAELLCEYYHQTEILFPARARRDAIVHALARHDPPLSRGDIAHKAGIGLRTVYSILSRPDPALSSGRSQPADDRQLHLFG